MAALTAVLGLLAQGLPVPFSSQHNETVSADVLVVFPGFACVADAYGGIAEAAGFQRAVLLPLFDDEDILREFANAGACGAACEQSLAARLDTQVDDIIKRQAIDPRRQRLTFLGHSAGASIAKRAALRWLPHALVYYGGGVEGNLHLPFRFLSIEGSDNWSNVLGVLQVTNFLGLARAAAEADALYTREHVRSSVSHVVLPGANHFSCVAGEAIARSNRWQALIGSGAMVQPPLDRRHAIGQMIGAFARGDPDGGATVGGEAWRQAWATVATPQADARWLAAAWMHEAGLDGWTVNVVVHTSSQSFHAAQPAGPTRGQLPESTPVVGTTRGAAAGTELLVHAFQPRGAVGEWWLKCAGPRVNARSLNLAAWAWAKEHTLSGLPGPLAQQQQRPQPTLADQGLVDPAAATGRLASEPAFADDVVLPSGEQVWANAPPLKFPAVRSRVASCDARGRAGFESGEEAGGAAPGTARLSVAGTGGDDEDGSPSSLGPSPPTSCWCLSVAGRAQSAAHLIDTRMAAGITPSSSS